MDVPFEIIAVIAVGVGSILFGAWVGKRLGSGRMGAWIMGRDRSRGKAGGGKNAEPSAVEPAAPPPGPDTET